MSLEATSPVVVDGRIPCPLCAFSAHSLLNHAMTAHGLTAEEWVLAGHGPTVSPLVLEALGGRRKAAPAPENLTARIMGCEVPVDVNVSAEQSLKRPDGYGWATQGKAKGVAQRLVQALIRGRNVFLWGLPGTGKDAAVQAFCAETRRPVVLISFKPGTDISPFFYTRAISAEGTSWEYGHVWDALVHGIEGRDGVRRAPLILLSDADRADAAQLEWFRLLTDSIEGRILGPDGKTVKLISGIQFVCTANSCGSGDARGRMASANVMDASIMDRLGQKIEAVHLDWADECGILRAKYPDLASSAPWLFEGPTAADGTASPGELGNACAALRDAIASEEVYAEFSHRGICDVLNRASDIMFFKRNAKAPKNLLAQAFLVWLEGLPADDRLAAKRLIDPHVGGGAFADSDEDADDVEVEVSF
jgi:hypothetical protein